MVPLVACAQAVPAKPRAAEPMAVARALRLKMLLRCVVRRDLCAMCKRRLPRAAASCARPSNSSCARPRYAAEHNQWPPKTTNEKTVTRHSWRLWSRWLSRSPNRLETACLLHIRATACTAAPPDSPSEPRLHTRCARVRSRSREHTVAGHGNCRAAGLPRWPAVKASAIIDGRIFVRLADRLRSESNHARQSAEPWDGDEQNDIETFSSWLVARLRIGVCLGWCSGPNRAVGKSLLH